MEDTETKTVLGMRIPVLVVFSSFVLGSLVLVISYLTNRLGRFTKNVNVVKEAEVESVDSRNSTNGGHASSNAGSTSNKRGKNKKRREAQQEFTHSWMVGALKGHSAPVLDMDFASNGKFLASCAEDLGGDGRGRVIDGEERRKAESKKTNAIPKTSSDPIQTASNRRRGETRSRVRRGQRRERGSESYDDLDEHIVIRYDSVYCGIETSVIDRLQSNLPSKESLSCAPVKRNPKFQYSSARLRKSANQKSVGREKNAKSALNESTDVKLEKKNPIVCASRNKRQESDGPKSSSSSSSSSSARHSVAVCKNGTSTVNQLESVTSKEGLNCTSTKRIAALRYRSIKSCEPDSHVGKVETAKARLNECSGPKSAKKSLVPKQSDSHLDEARVDCNNDIKCENVVKYQSLRSQFTTLSNTDLSLVLHKYTLSGMDLAYLGYPLQCIGRPGYAMFFNSGFPSRNRTSRTEATAQEFVPRVSKNSCSGESEGDSGNGTGSSVENSDQEQESSDTDKPGDGVDSSSPSAKDVLGHVRYSKNNSAGVEKTCARCSRKYYVDTSNDKYITFEKCRYHWGKLDSGSRGYRRWECCRTPQHYPGCLTADQHVWTGFVLGYNGPIKGYVRTSPRRVPPLDGYFGVYALDCEMCFTMQGFELVKITVVDIHGNIVYDTYVRPKNKVIDYNTRFSGIAAHHVRNAPKTLEDVQKDLLTFISAETILIGHGLCSDLRVLRILHPTVIDTSIIYPHSMGFPFRYSLKNLARYLLQRDIQMDEHDSAEDARATLDLALRRIQYDYT